MHCACGGLVVGFGRPSVGFCGLFVSFPQTLGCAFGELLVYSPDGGHLVGIWQAFGGLPVRFRFHCLFWCFGDLGGHLLCWQQLMWAFGGLLLVQAFGGRLVSFCQHFAGVGCGGLWVGFCFLCFVWWTFSELFVGLCFFFHIVLFAKPALAGLISSIYIYIYIYVYTGTGTGNWYWYQYQYYYLNIPTLL